MFYACYPVLTQCHAHCEHFLLAEFTEFHKIKQQNWRAQEGPSQNDHKYGKRNPMSLQFDLEHSVLRINFNGLTTWWIWRSCFCIRPSTICFATTLFWKLSAKGHFKENITRVSLPPQSSTVTPSQFGVYIWIMYWNVARSTSLNSTAFVQRNYEVFARSKETFRCSSRSRIKRG